MIIYLAGLTGGMVVLKRERIYEMLDLQMGGKVP